FVDGHAFYAKDDAGRRALGMPWVDTHVYAKENGMAIAALVTLARASGDRAYLVRARRAAERVLGTHVAADDAVARDAEHTAGPWYLGDAAWLGLGLVRLGVATGDAALIARARAIAVAIDARLADPATGALWGQTVDPHAVGVFAR